MRERMDAKTRQKTLRLLSNGVYVLTSRAGDRLGVATVTWVSQASFKPPLLMAAVRRSSNVFHCLAGSRVAALHILASDQRDVAQKFFSPTKGKDGSLNGEPFTTGKTSSPILRNIGAYVECKVIDIRENMAIMPSYCWKSSKPFAAKISGRSRSPTPLGNTAGSPACLLFACAPASRFSMNLIETSRPSPL